MSSRLFAALLFCSLLVGCGFQPLYGNFDSGSAGAEFLRVEIDATKDREGQIFRNELLRLFYGSHGPVSFSYRLRTELTSNTSSLAVRKSAFATRANLSMSGAYTLYDVRSGKQLHHGTSLVTVSYNILDSELATSLAEKEARDRAVRELSQDIKLRLGNYFNRSGKAGG